MKRNKIVRKRRKTNTGFKGVTKRGSNKTSKYESTLYINGIRIWTKGKKTLHEAVEARKEFILNLL